MRARISKSRYSHYLKKKNNSKNVPHHSFSSLRLLFAQKSFIPPRQLFYHKKMRPS